LRKLPPKYRGFPTKTPSSPKEYGSVAPKKSNAEEVVKFEVFFATSAFVFAVGERWVGGGVGTVRPLPGNIFFLGNLELLGYFDTLGGKE
jgi:hypothetical protein